MALGPEGSGQKGYLARAEVAELCEWMPVDGLSMQLYSAGHPRGSVLREI
jgi:hypothetical protein